MRRRELSYLRFVLCKENKDTLDSLSVIGALAAVLPATACCCPLASSDSPVLAVAPRNFR